MTNATTTTEAPNRWRSTDCRSAIWLIHLRGGMRYWAFDRTTGDDVDVGFRSDGYGSMDEAIAAVNARAATEVK